MFITPFELLSTFRLPFLNKLRNVSRHMRKKDNANDTNRKNKICIKRK